MKRFVNAILTTAVTAVLSTHALSAATVFTTTLAGANEQPASGSAGTGSAVVTLNGNSLNVFFTFSGLGSSDGAGHIHCCGPVGVNEPVAVPFTGIVTGVTSGTYSNLFDLTSAAIYTSSFLTANGGTASAAEAALIAGMNAGQAYVNIHTTQFPGGEIRGQLALAPEPGTIFLGGIALSVIALLKRRISQRS